MEIAKNQQKQNFDFLQNNLFTSYALEVDFPQIYAFEEKSQEAKEAFEAIKAIYDPQKFTHQNEHQFENDFIDKTLEILRWQSVRQDEKIIQGKTEKPDFLLFSTQNSKDSYMAIEKEKRQAVNEYISVILEVKAYTIPIDNKKVKDNPHFQILRYLSNLKINFGFLTNG